MSKATTVQCHAGFRGDEYPLRFRQGGQWLEVVRILHQAREPACRRFDVLAGDGSRYLLSHREAEDRWEVVRR